MNPERHEQIKKLFLAAYELAESQIGAFLDRECADDPQLRQELESLLRHHFPTTVIGRSPEEATALKVPLPIPRIPIDPVATTESSGVGAPKAVGRFAPGTVIVGRYRIMGLLGHGGMGEVYRADDLKLDQPVALKFLVRRRADDEQWTKGFLHEVRLARRVTHPNVNRVHDIGEADGETFISMEYVDGEDLVTLLRRIGRFTGDKTTEIAHQLCAGLGAAHDQGVLHRDLKPANIMVDGRGQIRITDFGIAALTTSTKMSLAGTPSFMAPELLQGGRPSIGSDLYSLGMVLYEIATGREPFDGVPADCRASDAAPRSPSTVCDDVDPALDQVILQCLDSEPARRPQSSYAVAAALPGGDPLAAALGVGKMPSPDMVAAAGGNERMRPRWAFVCLAVALVGLLGVVLLAGRTFLVPQAGLVEPPAVLSKRAKEITRLLGHEAARPGEVQGFSIDREYLDCLREEDDRRRNWDDLPSCRPPAIFYWCRLGDSRLAPPAPYGEPALRRELPAEPGVITVRLDGQERLLRFSAVPPASATVASPHGTPNWPEVFQFAELEIADFHAVAPAHRPPMYADHVVAWEGVYPEKPDVAIRVEAAALGGRVVYFDVDQRMPQSADLEKAARTARMPTQSFAPRFALYTVALVGGLLLARRNLQLGRCDRRGARRLALLVFVLTLLDWLVGERHVADFVEEATSAYLWMTRAVFAAAATWGIYVAVEPLLRRFWPHTLITWSRLLKGRFRDPLVGRDLLLGGMVGVGIALLLQLDSLLPGWFGWPRPVPKLPGAGFELAELLGLRYKLGTVIGILLGSLSLGLVLVVLLLLLRVTLQVHRLAEATFFGLITAACASVMAYDTFLPWATGACVAATVLIVLTRLGLVALISGLFVRSILMNSPVTPDIKAWYAPTGNLAVVLVALLLVYGSHTVLAERRLDRRKLVRHRE